MSRFPARALLVLVITAWVAAPLRAQEVATVEVAGSRVFPVAALDGVSAALRAQQIGDSLETRLASGLPLAPIRVVEQGTAALLMIGQDTLLRVTPRDAEVVLARALSPRGAAQATGEVARQWASSLREVFGRAAQEERARVVVEGTPLFEVAGTPELRAARRAEAVGVRIAELAAADEVPPIRVVGGRDGAAVRAGDLVLVEVSRAEAAARGVSPEELAGNWATQIERVVETLRRRTSASYRIRILAIALAATAAAVVAYLLLRRLARRIERRSPAESTHAWGLVPVLMVWAVSVAQFLVWGALVGFVLWLVPRTRPLTFAAGTRVVDWLGVAAAWLLGPGLIVAGIVLGTYFVARFAGAVVHHLILTFGTRHGGRVQLRAETLAATVAGAGQLVIWFLGLVAVLAYLEVNPLPLLASAGVAGIAIGFGVQSLIRDFFTGLFILLEDQYGVGDLIKVGAVSGKVERFTLRITQVRGLDGSLTSIPNGEILTVTNLSKDWSQVVLDVNIKLGENVDRAIAVINEAAHELTQEWGDRIQGEPEVLGVETVDPLAEAVTIRVVLRTAPLERWAASRELRRRVLEAFRQEKIQVPPRAVVTAPGPPPPVQ